jgi:hypothetical protein
MTASTTPVPARVEMVSVILNQLESSGPIGAAINIAIKGVLTSGISAKLDEEVTSSALLGALVANYPWCAILCVNDLEDMEECSWSQFRKGGKSKASESHSGADYALVLKKDEFDVRIAVVQAKRGHKNTPGKRFIDVHRKAVEDEAGAVMVQMRRLHNLAHALRGLKPAAIGDTNLSLCNFVHYVGYFNDSICAVQLSSLKDAYVNELATPAPWFNDVEVGKDSPSLAAVLLDGLHERKEDLVWWVSVTQERAEALLPDLIRIMDVYSFEKGKTGRPLKPKMDRPAQGLRVDRQAAKEFLGQAEETLKASAPSRRHKP